MAIFTPSIQVDRLREELCLLRFIVSNIKTENIDLTKITEKLFSKSAEERSLASQAMKLLGVSQDNVGR